jgi:hypothetical protein
MRSIVFIISLVAAIYNDGQDYSGLPICKQWDNDEGLSCEADENIAVIPGGSSTGSTGSNSNVVPENGEQEFSKFEGFFASMIITYLLG